MPNFVAWIWMEKKRNYDSSDRRDWSDQKKVHVAEFTAKDDVEAKTAAEQARAKAVMGGSWTNHGSRKSGKSTTRFADQQRSNGKLFDCSILYKN
jgi:hypothetical protein